MCEKLQRPGYLAKFEGATLEHHKLQFRTQNFANHEAACRFQFVNGRSYEHVTDPKIRSEDSQISFSNLKPSYPSLLLHIILKNGDLPS